MARSIPSQKYQVRYTNHGLTASRSCPKSHLLSTHWKSIAPNKRGQTPLYTRQSKANPKFRENRNTRSTIVNYIFTKKRLFFLQSLLKISGIYYKPVTSQRFNQSIRLRCCARIFMLQYLGIWTDFTKLSKHSKTVFINLIHQDHVLLITEHFFFTSLPKRSQRIKPICYVL